MTLKKNDIVNLTITSATAEGSGVGRTDDGIAVFVQGSAIGLLHALPPCKTEYDCDG